MTENDENKADASSDAEDEEEFQVERIIRKRIGAGNKTEYYLKWKGYAETENTWEPEDNLDCPELIEEFEKNQAELQRKEKERKRSLTPALATKDTNVSTSNKKIKRDNDLKGNDETGFDKGKVADKIIGATDSQRPIDKCQFLVKWKDSDDAELVPSSKANKEIPQMVIKFYEDHLSWQDITKAV